MKRERETVEKRKGKKYGKRKAVGRKAWMRE